MGDMRQYYDDLKAVNRDGRAKRLAKSKIAFREHGIKVEEKNDGVHWIATAGDIVFDFYPTTHTWARRGDKKRSRGINDFLGAYKRAKGSSK